MTDKTIKQRVETLEMLDDVNISSIRELREQIADIKSKMLAIIEAMKRREDDDE
jgi:hypothetical protein